jgi:hypothetical protein
MSDPLRNVDGPTSGAQSDWWSSSDTRLNPSAKVREVDIRPSVAQPAGNAGDTRWSPGEHDGATTSAFKASYVALLLAGVLVIVGSITSWISVSLFGHTVSVAGTDRVISNAISINGWITVALGIVILLIGALMMVSPEASLRLLAICITGLTLGFSTYYVVRVVQELSKAHAAAARYAGFGRSFPVSEHIGWGLVVLLVAAVGAVISSGMALREA